MDLIEQEREKYRKAWDFDGYRVSSPGLRHLEEALKWMQPRPGASITDWGSGSGKASEAMRDKGFAVRMVDIAANAYRGTMPVTEACLWSMGDDIGPTEYGYCADVMEHIPTEKVDDVLDGIAKRTIRKCYFQIALFEDTCFTHAGPLHLSVFPAEWWMEKLERKFKVCEYRKIRMVHLLAVCE